MQELLTVGALVSLMSLTMMEIVLGIDNIIFISILCNRLPESQQERARMVGLGLALIVRVGLLLGISWLIGLDSDFWHPFGHGISGKDMILMAGGLFLIYKSTIEIHSKIKGDEEHGNKGKTLSFGAAIVQIVLLDIVFSFDSILTAVGLVEHVEIMIVAVIISMGIMIWASRPIAKFINENPTLKMLALSFLLMIGILLFAEGLGEEIEKGYVYFAIFFSLGVELLNMYVRSRAAKSEDAAKAE